MTRISRTRIWHAEKLTLLSFAMTHEGSHLRLVATTSPEAVAACTALKMRQSLLRSQVSHIVERADEVYAATEEPGTGRVPEDMRTILSQVWSAAHEPEPDIEEIQMYESICDQMHEAMDAFEQQRQPQLGCISND